MLRRDEDWTVMMRASLDDPDMPAEMKDPSRWPAQLREELGDDFGATSAGKARQVFRRHFAEARRALDDFKPDVIVMFGDDQYENFKEDIVPPFAVLAYEDRDIQPWKHRRSSYNPWNEPADKTFRLRGHRQAGKYLASGLLEAGIDAAYAYKPLHHPLGHAFENTILLLDDERVGFDYPLRAVFGELLWPARQCRPRAAPAIGNARQNPRPRPAFAQPAALHGSRRRHCACHGEKPVAHRDRRLVELVALAS